MKRNRTTPETTGGWNSIYRFFTHTETHTHPEREIHSLQTNLETVTDFPQPTANSTTNMRTNGKCVSQNVIR